MPRSGSGARQGGRAPRWRGTRLYAIPSRGGFGGASPPNEERKRQGSRAAAAREHGWRPRSKRWLGGVLADDGDQESEAAVSDYGTFQTAGPIRASSERAVVGDRGASHCRQVGTIAYAIIGSRKRLQVQGLREMCEILWN
jgi:hypothetical protein